MIGVVGGGQLARMLVQAAAQRDVPIAVQTSDAADPAAGLASRLVAADPRDVAGTRELVVGCDGITFENEWVNIDALLPLEQQGVRFQPSLAALSPLVDKLSQRQLLDDLAIPSPPWCPLSLISPAQPALPQGWTFPVMAKASRGGYDGKGTVVVLSPAGEILREIDVLGARPSNLCFGGTDGRTVYVTEVVHRRLVKFRVETPGAAWKRWGR